LSSYACPAPDQVQGGRALTWFVLYKVCTL
jgi:hypothetical protein